MASDDRNTEFDNLTATDSFTDPGGTTHSGTIGGSIALENTDGTTLVSTDTLGAGRDLTVSDDGDGTATLDVAGAVARTDASETVTSAWTFEAPTLTVESTTDAGFILDAASGAIASVDYRVGGAAYWRWSVSDNNGTFYLTNRQTGTNHLTVWQDAPVTAEPGMSMAVQDTAPSGPLDGDIYYADGATWDPGSGEGLYGYAEGEYVETTRPRTVADGTVALTSGSATVSTGVTTTGTRLGVALDPSGDGANSADVSVIGRVGWDNAAGEYTVDIVEEGTSVGNPTVGYDIVTY